jgi:hypothetical protein
MLALLFVEMVVEDWSIDKGVTIGPSPLGYWATPPNHVERRVIYPYLIMVHNFKPRMHTSQATQAHGCPSRIYRLLPFTGGEHTGSFMIPRSILIFSFAHTPYTHILYSYPQCFPEGLQTHNSNASLAAMKTFYSLIW